MKSNEPKETLIKPEFILPKEIWNRGEIIEGLYEVLAGPFDGGMGRVYKVKHLKWGIELAGKCPLPQFWKDKALMKRFEREVEAWTEMGRHPNIVNAYYLRDIDGIPYLFMDWMDGGSLKDWLYGKSWETHKEELLLYAIGIATGMERIHELGLIHRDLKLANCLISHKYKTIGVSDLGTIKFLGIEDLKEAESLRNIFKGTVWGEMTGMGRFIGTPEYGAPEQFEGKAIKESDIYSFFVMLYQMVCSKLPFELPFEIARLVLSNPPLFQRERLTFFKEAHQKKTLKEPKEHVPEIPSSLNELIMKGLAKDPKERPASFTEVKERLKEIYLEVSGREYKEPEIDKSYQRADDLNNKALTYIDLGMPKKRIKSLFQEALKEEASHLETIFNYGYFRWKSGEIDPYNDWYQSEILSLEPLYKHIGRYWLYRAMAEAEIGLYERAKESAKKAKELGEEDRILEETLNLPLPKVFKGHTDLVYCLSFSPDGRYVVSGSWDTTLRLWDVKKSKCISIFKGHIRGVTCLSFSPDGRYVVSGSLDKTLRLWDVEKAKCIRVFEGHTDGISCFSFGPNGKYVVSGSEDETLRLWDIETGKCIRIFKGHTGPVYCLSFSPDGRYVVSGSGDKTLRLWDVETGKCIRIFEGHTEPVLCLSFSPDGRYVVSGSSDKTLMLWELDWEYEFPEPKDWDEGARPYLKIFLHLHPNWKEEDFKKLLSELQLRGFGWLSSDGIHRELKKAFKNALKTEL